MTISKIKNPWIRRPLTIMLAPLFLLAMPTHWEIQYAAKELAEAIRNAFADVADSVAAAWRGEE